MIDGSAPNVGSNLCQNATDVACGQDCTRPGCHGKRPEECTWENAEFKPENDKQALVRVCEREALGPETIAMALASSTSAAPTLIQIGQVPITRGFGFADYWLVWRHAKRRAEIAATVAAFLSVVAARAQAYVNWNEQPAVEQKAP